MVSAIILSINTSSPDEAKLHNIVEVLHSARVLDIAIVCGENEQHAEHFKRFDGKVISVKDSLGEISSIIVGLDALEQGELHGILIVPSNEHRLSQAIVVDLLHQFWISHKHIVIAAYDSGRGFPVILSDALFSELRQQPSNTSLASFINDHSNDIKVVEFDKEGNMVKPKPAVVSPETSMDENI